MKSPRILVAGIGNIFLGDDGFGVEVAQRLARQPLPEGVRVVDFGIRGLDLTYALLDGEYDALILVDAAPRGAPPGSVFVIEPEIGEDAIQAQDASPFDGHDLDPAKVLQLARKLGKLVPRILLVGCEPMPGCEEGMQLEMSEPVRRAVEHAVPLIESLLPQILESPTETTDKPVPVSAGLSAASTNDA